MINGINKLTIVVQEVKTKDNENVDVVFGTVLLTPEDKKSKTGETINFHILLGENKAFENHINRIIKQALKLKKEQEKVSK